MVTTCSVGWCICVPVPGGVTCAVHRKHPDLRPRELAPDEELDPGGKCDECKGTGKCSTCEGKAGWTCVCDECDNEHEVECEDCDQTGECPDCCGSGGGVRKKAASEP